MSEENKKETLHITVFHNETEKEAVAKVKEAQAILAQRHRDDVLYNSADIVSSLKALPDKVVYHPFPTPVPLATEWKEQWKKQPPQKIEEKLKDLKEFQTELEGFPENFDAHALKNIPCNWRQSFVTKEEYVADVRKMHHKGFETVNEATKYVKELIQATSEALLEKQAELDAHEGEIDPLVKECTKIVSDINKLYPEFLRAKRQAEITVLSEKDVEKFVKLFNKYTELNHTFDIKLQRLAEISAHKPEVLASIPRPQGLPPLPGQLERRIKRR